MFRQPTAQTINFQYKGSRMFEKKIGSILSKLVVTHAPSLPLHLPPSLPPSLPQTKSTLSQPKWPSYKLHGVTQSKFLDACPSNLHTSIMSVIPLPEGIRSSASKGSISDILTGDTLSTSGSVSGRSLSDSSRSISESDDDILAPPNSHTSYAITTMQIPTAVECSGAVSVLNSRLSGIISICMIGLNHDISIIRTPISSGLPIYYLHTLSGYFIITRTLLFS